MRVTRTLLVLVLFAAAAAARAADRQWQTGTWVDVGTKRNAWVGDPTGGSSGGFGGRAVRPIMPQVGLYTLETEDQRIELEDIAPFGTPGSFDQHVVVGKPVTIALSKNTAYIRLPDGTEYRLRVSRKGPRTKR